MSKYYVLLQRDADICNNKLVEPAFWMPVFGDYDRECVEFERQDYRDHGFPAKGMKIVITTGKQEDIDKILAELNN